MTPRQRWMALLAGESADRIPADYQATEEVTGRLMRDLQCPDPHHLWNRLQVDHRMFLEPRWRLPHHPDDPQADMWGVRYQTVDYGTGTYQEPCHHPLEAVRCPADVHAHRWPEPDDFDYSAITQSVERSDGYYPIHAGHFEPLMIYGYMRGLERALEDLLLHPDIADAALGRLYDFHYDHIERIFRAGKGRIDLTWVAEDLGTQAGPLISLETYRRFLMPQQIKMADLARSYNVHVMYHTDGAARPFLPDLIDRVGIEVLNPIQWRCPGMQREQLVADFGDRIIFHGSIDNQRTLAFGSIDDVVREVRESMAIYSSARWICAPCHNIQPVTPTENILAMYQALRDEVEATGE